MQRALIPAEFEDLLSRAGRKVLAGTHPLCGALADPRTRFVMADDLIDHAKAARLRRVLEEKLAATLEPMERPIPPESIWSMRHDYEERLPKTSRALTIYFESRREAGARAAERIGLAQMMRSASFRAFAEALSGRKLASGWGLQVLRYGPGDYAGPHVHRLDAGAVHPNLEQRSWQRHQIDLAARELGGQVGLGLTRGQTLMVIGPHGLEHER